MFNSKSFVLFKLWTLRAWGWARNKKRGSLRVGIGTWRKDWERVSLLSPELENFSLFSRRLIFLSFLGSPSFPSFSVGNYFWGKTINYQLIGLDYEVLEVSREEDEKSVWEHWAWEHGGKKNIFFASQTRGWELFLMLSWCLSCLLFLDIPSSSFWLSQYFYSEDNNYINFTRT